MCKTLLEIMSPEIDKIRADDAQKSILRAVESLREVGTDDERIKEQLVKHYELTPNEAAAYLRLDSRGR